MGLFGWGWLKDEVEKLEALKSILKNEDEIKAVDEIIDDLNNKAK